MLMRQGEARIILAIDSKEPKSKLRQFKYHLIWNNLKIKLYTTLFKELNANVFMPV